MKNVKERLDEMKAMMQDSDYLEGKGLSNKINIRIFCYEPKEEMIVRHFIKQILDEPLRCRVIHYDLYDIFLDLCKEKRILDRIPALEERRGKDFIRKQLEKSCDAKTFAAKMQYENHQRGDVIVLSSVGKVFPFMRIHALLEAMQPLFNDVPVLVFYPGDFDGHYVKLFNRLKPNEYYRAFKAV